MHVLYFTESLNAHDMRFMRAYRDRGHEVTLLVLRTGPEITLPSGVRPIGSWHGLPDPPSYLDPAGQRLDAFVEPMRTVLARIDPDLVHAGPLTSSGSIAAMAGARRLVGMSWGSDVLLQGARDAAAAERIARTVERAEVLQCDSSATRRALIERFSASLRQVALFPWGLDPFVLPPLPRREPSENETVQVLSFRDWEPVYGIETLLEGFRRAADADPRLQLRLGGHGSLEPFVRSFVADRLSGRCDILGSMSHHQLAHELASADLYISCSLSDGTSVSLLEAMANGLPAIVSDIPGNREWVHPGWNGWRFAAGEADDLCEKLLESLERRDAWIEYGERSRSQIRRRACWPRNVGRFLERMEQPERPRVVAIIQARIGSSRLPAKVAAPIEGRPLLAHIIDRTRAAETIDDIVIATTELAEDDLTVSIAEEEAAAVFRGDAEDVLDRCYHAARWSAADVVVRITADDAFKDPDVIDRVVEPLLDDASLDYSSSSLTPTFPEGLDAEAVRFSALEKAWREATLVSEREHVTPYIWKNPDRFCLHGVTNSEDLSALRWTVDYPEDLAFVRAVYGELGESGQIFGMDEVLALLKERPDLQPAPAERNEGYKRSIAVDHDQEGASCEG